MFFRASILFFLRLYQRTLSPDHGWLRVRFPYGYCRYAPSCSSYAIAAIARYGVVRGGGKSVWRVFRCNPLSSGGIDPLK